MSLLVVLGDMSGGESLIISARFSSRIGDRTLHPGIWEKLGEALLWLQLCWIIAGFALMVYLALKVFPKSGGRTSTGDRGPASIGYDGSGGRQSLIAGNYRLESFPQWQGDRTKILEFRPEITATKRRLS